MDLYRSVVYLTGNTDVIPIRFSVWRSLNAVARESSRDFKANGTKKKTSWKLPNHRDVAFKVFERYELVETFSLARKHDEPERSKIRWRLKHRRCSKFARGKQKNVG